VGYERFSVNGHVLSLQLHMDFGLMTLVQYEVYSTSAAARRPQ
jgi:hypothetical protein